MSSVNPTAPRYLTLDLVTPAKRIVVGARVASIQLTTEVGQIEILPGHADLIGLLGTGLLRFVDLDSEVGERRFAVSFGFLEVHGDKVLVLAETCEQASEIDVARAKAAEQRAQVALAGSLEGGEFRKQSLKLERALIRQQAAASAR